MPCGDTWRTTGSARLACARKPASIRLARAGEVNRFRSVCCKHPIRSAMDRATFRKKVILDLLSSPWTVIPPATGASLVLASWATGDGAGMLMLLGISALLGSVGSIFTRWIFRSDKITREAFNELLADEERKQQAKLDELDESLRQDRDP